METIIHKNEMKKLQQHVSMKSKHNTGQRVPGPLYYINNTFSQRQLVFHSHICKREFTVPSLFPLFASNTDLMTSLSIFGNISSICKINTNVLHHITTALDICPPGLMTKPLSSSQLSNKCSCYMCPLFRYYFFISSLTWCVYLVLKTLNSQLNFLCSQNESLKLTIHR